MVILCVVAFLIFLVVLGLYYKETIVKSVKDAFNMHDMRDKANLLPASAGGSNRITTNKGASMNFASAPFESSAQNPMIVTSWKHADYL